jgi:hypothetical protein
MAWTNIVATIGMHRYGAVFFHAEKTWILEPHGLKYDLAPAIVPRANTEWACRKRALEVSNRFCHEAGRGGLCSAASRFLTGFRGCYIRLSGGCMGGKTQITFFENHPYQTKGIFPIPLSLVKTTVYSENTPCKCQGVTLQSSHVKQGYELYPMLCDRFFVDPNRITTTSFTSFSDALRCFVADSPAQMHVALGSCLRMTSMDRNKSPQDGVRHSNQIVVYLPL